MHEQDSWDDPNSSQVGTRPHRDEPNYGARPVGDGLPSHPRTPQIRQAALDQATVQSTDTAQRAAGVKSVLGGAVLIGIGLAMGGSVFTGDPTALDWVFDGLGTFWVVKGLIAIFTA